MLNQYNNYKSSRDLIKTQSIIKDIKDTFQNSLAKNLNLIRVTAPIFVSEDSGLNDDLSGVEKPVSFEFNSGNHKEKAEVVQSLAKWKRFALKKYKFSPGRGLYTDMNAIRPNEILDSTHSLYVDQWDWEKVIRKEDRTMDYLITTVQYIYEAFLDLDKYLERKYEKYMRLLPDKIHFINSQELEDLYPNLSPKEREGEIAKKYKAVFISQIGKILKSGTVHDKRAADYDDWNLNGDIIFYSPRLNAPLELSSMGIRVDSKKLLDQLEISNQKYKLNMEYHKLLVENKLPLTIGGGIGQSRICMFFMQKVHIGEVQASIWPKEMIRQCQERGIILL